MLHNVQFVVVNTPARSPRTPTQADTKPGCVLRSANVVEVLQRKRGLLTNEDVETCKGGMNTWGYVGDLNDHPQLSCVYQSDDAQNEFLSNPKVCLYSSRSSLTCTGLKSLIVIVTLRRELRL